MKEFKGEGGPAWLRTAGPDAGQSIELAAVPPVKCYRRIYVLCEVDPPPRPSTLANKANQGLPARDARDGDARATSQRLQRRFPHEFLTHASSPIDTSTSVVCSRLLWARAVLNLYAPPQAPAEPSHELAATRDQCQCSSHCCRRLAFE